MNKKYKILIIFLGVIIVITLFLLIWSKNFFKDKEKNIFGNEVIAPEFMTNKDKEKLKVPLEMKAQIMNRDESGDISVYKIISNDKDIVLDPNKIPSISPRQKK